MALLYMSDIRFFLSFQLGRLLAEECKGSLGDLLPVSLPHDHVMSSILDDNELRPRYALMYFDTSVIMHCLVVRALYDEHLRTLAAPNTYSR